MNLRSLGGVGAVPIQEILMSASADEVTRAVLHEAIGTLEQSLARIHHCLDQLTDEQIWWRPDESLNAIGNLVLHLVGNVRQWIVSGLGGTSDKRNRPAEFSERRGLLGTSSFRPLTRL